MATESKIWTPPWPQYPQSRFSKPTCHQPEVSEKDGQYEKGVMDLFSSFHCFRRFHFALSRYQQLSSRANTKLELIVVAQSHRNSKGPQNSYESAEAAGIAGKFSVMK